MELSSNLSVKVNNYITYEITQEGEAPYATTRHLTTLSEEEVIHTDILLCRATYKVGDKRYSFGLNIAKFMHNIKSTQLEYSINASKYFNFNQSVFAPFTGELKIQCDSGLRYSDQRRIRTIDFKKTLSIFEDRYRPKTRRSHKLKKANMKAYLPLDIVNMVDQFDANPNESTAHLLLYDLNRFARFVKPISARLSFVEEKDGTNFEFAFYK